MKTDLVTARILAETLHLSEDTIWRYTREGKIPFIRLGAKQYRYNLAEVISALNLPAGVKEKKGDYHATGLLTYEDYLTLPEVPGYRLEILEGELIRDPAPSILHQVASRKLLIALDRYFALTESKGLLLNAPVDVVLEDITVVQPDLLFVEKEYRGIIKENCIAGAPTLAVEIISPSTRSKDSIKKLQLYQKAGVKHYWLVDPEEKTFHAFQLGEKGYSLAAAGEGEDTLTHPEFPGLEIPLADLWRLD